MRPVLGIESSCDETAAAVLDAEGRVLADLVLSQEREHAPGPVLVADISRLATADDLWAAIPFSRSA